MSLASLVLCALLNFVQDESVVIHYLKERDSMVVSALINGKGPFSFVVDTGATTTVISPKVAADLGLTGNGKRSRLIGVGGRPMTAHHVILAELALGGAKARGLDVVVYPITHLNDRQIVGLLGHDFLDRFTYQVDPHKQAITLRLPGEAKPQPPPEETPLERKTRAVLAEPADAFAQADTLYAGLTGEPRLTQARELRAHAREMGRLHSRLLNLNVANLDATQNHHVQVFLLCYPIYRAWLERAQAFLADGGVETQGAHQAAWQRFNKHRP